MAEGVEIESLSSRYFCHKCSHEISLCRPTELVCPDCSSSFIEEISKNFYPTGVEDEDDDDNPYETDDDDEVPFHMSSFLNQMLHSLPSPGTHSDSSTDHRSSTEPSETEDESFSVEGLLQHLNFTGRLSELADDVLHVNLLSHFLADFEGDAEYDAIASQLLDEVEMSGPPPLSREQIQALPKETLTSHHIERSSQQCTVCMDDFCAKEEVIFLPCTHMYHDRCITPWLQRQATCPNCREVIHLGGSGATSKDH